MDGRKCGKEKSEGEVRWMRGKQRRSERTEYGKGGRREYKRERRQNIRMDWGLSRCRQGREEKRNEEGG